MPKRATTIGRLLLQQTLPEDLYRDDLVLDKKGVSELLAKVGQQYPERYREISHKLVNLGHTAAYETGGNSFGLSDLLAAKAAIKYRQQLQTQLASVLDDDDISDDERDALIISITGAMSKPQEDEILAESLAEKNPLAMQLKGAGRGNPTNLASLRGSDMLMSDHHGNTIPIPITRSYSEGLDPASYFAAAYGARKSVLDTKLMTADAGYFAKQLSQAAHRLVVTAMDRDEDDGVIRGFPVDIDDNDNEGALLAIDTGGYDKNTFLTPKILRDLQARGVKRLLVRSPVASGSPEGGVYARDVGVREKGGLPGIGEQVGLTAAAAIGEPTSQGMLCLARGTRVRLASGETMPIECLLPGDRVVAIDYESQAPTTATVVRLYNNGPKLCQLTVFGRHHETQCDLVSSPDHKVLGNPYLNYFGLGELIPVKDVEHVTTFPNLDPRQAFIRTVTLSKSFENWVGMHDTFDIEIDHPDHTFLLENGLAVSNSSKHAGGVAGASATKTVGGFDAINQLVQVPEVFQGGATHATLDGTVERIDVAPAGGQFVIVNSEKHYVPQGLPLKVKAGDRIEAGDVLSEGTPNPGVITQYKGIGEGRRYFVKAFRDTYKGAGIKVHRRNVELLSRGLINHVRLTDEVGGGVPDDVLPYSVLEHNYEPRDGYRDVEPSQGVNRYLEKPVLHYSIGTKVRPSMLQDFKDFNIKSVSVHDDPPPFESEMVRGMSNLTHDQDWMTKMLGSGLKGSFSKAVQRGATSDPTGTSYVPALAQATTFGRQGLVRTPGPPIKQEESDNAPPLPKIPQPKPVRSILGSSIL